jgi:hypothetical protein
MAIETGWNMTPFGLEWDREWMLVDRETSRGLSMKQCPAMCLIRPSIELKHQCLCVKFQGKDVYNINIEKHLHRMIIAFV